MTCKCSRRRRRQTRQVNVVQVPFSHRTPIATEVVILAISPMITIIEIIANGNSRPHIRAFPANVIITCQNKLPSKQISPAKHTWNRFSVCEAKEPRSSLSSSSPNATSRRTGNYNTSRPGHDQGGSSRIPRPGGRSAPTNDNNDNSRRLKARVEGYVAQTCRHPGHLSGVLTRYSRSVGCCRERSAHCRPRRDIWTESWSCCCQEG